MTAKLFCRPIMKWAGSRSLVGRNRSRKEPDKGRFGHEDVRRLLEQAWRQFDQYAPSLPRERTMGGRMNMTLACVSISFFRSLLAAGTEREYAIELFADLAWKVYEKWGVLPRLLARLVTRDPVKRLRICVNLFLLFPFNAPSYIFDRLPSADRISIDMRRCPVAEYFRRNQAADLCVGSWCNLDYALVEMWGGRLERAWTLAAGDNRCSFRFLPIR